MVDKPILVRVRSVRVQSRSGAIFRGERINDSGEIIDAYREVIARVQADAIGVKVAVGQWWRLSGTLGERTFINAGGFEMTEEHLEVAPGGASLVLPSGAHIVDYIARNARFEGIGPVSARRLWERFDTRLADLLDSGDHLALEQVISPLRARVLIDGWREEGLSKTLQWLQQCGIDIPIGRRIVDYFGADANTKIEENAYRLLSFSAGWDEVDRLATSTLGVALDDERRLAAAVEESVYRRLSRGDTFVPRDLLTRELQTLLKVGRRSDAILEVAISTAESQRRILFDQAGNAYGLGVSILENRVVDAIASRRGLTSPACDVDASIARYEAREGFALNAEQRAAVHMVAGNHFSVITGGAGCGKTTVLMAVCEVLEAQGYDIVQLALAGKACKRMQESTGRPAMTLASYLSKLRAGEQRIGMDGSKAVAILIDEASMVDLLSFSRLVHEIEPCVKLVLIGDPHQLPPVGPGLVLHCLGAESVPHVELVAAKRFGTEIAAAANAIRDGAFPSLPSAGNVRLIETADHEMADSATNLYVEAPNDTVVLTATRAMAQSINASMQSVVSAGRDEVRIWNEEFDCYESTGLREHDLVICTKNHWDLGLQNGSIGRIAKLRALSSAAIGVIEWDDGEERPFDSALLGSLDLAYALTVHKAQGSQWRRIIVCLPAKARLIDRSLVYTAFTRAKAEVIILGSPDAIAAAVARRKAADRRHVGLPMRLSQMSPNASESAKSTQ